jgi:hypothetical protein
LLLSPTADSRSVIGLEAAIASGALTSLDALAQGGDLETAGLARALRERMTNALQIRGAGARALPVLENNDSETIVGNGQWLRLDMQAGLEYSVTATQCDWLSVLAVAMDERTGIAGGTTFGGRFAFVSDRTEPALIHLGTGECGPLAEFTVSTAAQAELLPDAQIVDVAYPVRSGQRYVGRFAGYDDQWLRFRATGGMRYVLNLVPIDSIDTVLTVYESDALREVAYDDDGGGNLASRIELSRPDDFEFLIKLTELRSAAGEFEFNIEELESGSLSARFAVEGETYSDFLDTDGESWWRFDAYPTSFYVIDAMPAEEGVEGSVDPVMTLYEADGFTEIAFNDDGGILTGASRVQLQNESERTLLARIREFSGISGAYEFRVTRRPPLIETAIDARVGGSESYRLALKEEVWFRVSTEAGKRYTFEVVPIDALDSEIALFDSDGVTMLAYDDDGGTTSGSLLSYWAVENGPLLVRVNDVGGRREGEFELVVSQVDVSEVSPRQIYVDDSVRTEVSSAGFDWWQFEAEGGNTYVFEATPAAGTDTVMWLYAEDGVTELDYDDDGAGNLGSRIEYTFDDPALVLIQVRDFIDTSGAEYTLHVSER